MLRGDAESEANRFSRVTCIFGTMAWYHQRAVSWHSIMETSRWNLHRGGQLVAFKNLRRHIARSGKIGLFQFNQFTGIDKITGSKLCKQIAGHLRFASPGIFCAFLDLLFLQ
jgi:hypothetical protein